MCGNQGRPSAVCQGQMQASLVWTPDLAFPFLCGEGRQGVGTRLGPPGCNVLTHCRELARADSAVLLAPTVEFLRYPFNVSPQLWLVLKVCVYAEHTSNSTACIYIHTMQNGYFSNKKLRERLKQLQLKVLYECIYVLLRNAHCVLIGCGAG